MSHASLHSNSIRFLEIMDELDFRKWNKYHPTEDFGQAIKRMAIEDGNIEDDDWPSEAAITIALKVLEKYRKKPKQTVKNKAWPFEVTLIADGGTKA